MPCHQPSPPAAPHGAWRDGPVSSPPAIPSREIWPAGGRGCPCSSGEITEISPHHSAVFLFGALARRAARDLLVSSASWNSVDPCLLQICLSGLGPALLLNAKCHIFMRGRCFSSPVCPTALPCLWGIPSLCCWAVGRAPGGLCLGKLCVKEGAN